MLKEFVYEAALVLWGASVLAIVVGALTLANIVVCSHADNLGPGHILAVVVVAVLNAAAFPTLGATSIYLLYQRYSTRKSK